MPYCRDPVRTPNLHHVRTVRAHRRGADRELARALGAIRSPISRDQFGPADGSAAGTRIRLISRHAGAASTTRPPSTPLSAPRFAEPVSDVNALAATEPDGQVECAR
jgi:hypothetical protein